MKLEFDLNVHIHQVDVPRLERILSRMLSVLTSLQRQGVEIMGQLEDLEAEVTADTDVTSSAVTLLEGIYAALQAAKNDPVRLQAVIDKLKSNKDVLAAAIVANTPAA